MIASLVNHLWQSTLFVLGAGGVAFSLRKNGAHIRHRIWLAASLKFLVPFSVLMSLGGAMAPARPTPVDAVAPEPAPLSVTVDRIAQPFTQETFALPERTSPDPEINWVAILLGSTWLAGFVAVVWIRLRGWRRIRAALRGSTPARIVSPIPVRSSPTLLEPGIVGIRSPVLLLPAGIERHLSPQQLDAVLAHELCHVQRRDNLTSAIHMVVEAMFWFYPLVWIVGARLIRERERACDEHVLRVCGEPQAYAEGILNVCKLYVESPVVCVSGVSGADLKRRVVAIVNNRIGDRLNVAKRVVVIAAAALAVLLPLVAGALVAPLRASSFSPAKTIGNSPGQTFDVVSIKPCDPNTPPTIGGSPGRRGYPPWIPQTSPGYVVWTCATLAQLIDQAYVDKDHPLLNTTRSPRLGSPQPKRIRGGPSWVESDKFTIEAKMPVEPGQPAGASASRFLTTLPATISQSLRALLEDRFQLKVHRATEQQEMYALTIAKSGLNKTRVTAPKPGDCQTIEQYSAAAAQSTPAMYEDPKICGRAFSGRGGINSFWSFTLQQLAADLSGQMDLFVIDRTGVTDPFNFTLVLRGMEAGDERWISQVAELGLKIDRVKAPAEYLQIDSAQKPKPDFTVAPQTSQLTSTLPQAGMQITFDVVSIKPCAADGQSAGQRGGATSMRNSITPGFAYWGCVSLTELIDQAWGGGAFPNNTLLNTIRVPPGRRPDLPKRVRGGPSWVEEERFAIEIKLSGDNTDLTGSARHNLVLGAMAPALRAMLEDRFQLKLRKATEQVPMYAMTVGKDGLKITQIGPQKCCGPEIKLRINGDNKVLDFANANLTDLTKWLSETMDRYVLDKTGVEGRFNFTFQYAPDDSTPGDTYSPFERRRAQVATAATPGDGPTIINALAALGLRLEPTKGPAEYLLIESAQKPRPDLAAGAVSR